MNKTLRGFMNRYWILLVLIIIKLVLQFLVVNPVYELHRDEFLYLNQSDHLAFGYISVPPFTALLSKIVFLLGGGLFWVRFFPALFGVLTLIFVWLIIESLEGSLFANILASTALVFSALMRINILYQPNSFDILTWTLVFYLLIRFVQSEENKWLWILSVVVAVGFYNKYNMIFLIVGLIIGLILTDQRKIFSNSAFWKAMAICIILLLPNIIWQIENHFPVFQHMKVLKANQLDNNTSVGFLKSQAMFFIGSVALTLGALIAFSYFKAFRPFRFIGICFISVMALFAIMKAKDYYAVGLYPVVFAFGSVYIDTILSQRWRPFILSFLILFNLVIYISVFKILFPVYSPAMIRENAAVFEKYGMLRWEDGKNHNLPQDFADMLGWHEMADKSLEAYKMIPADQLAATLIICSNYGQAGALNYYNRKTMPQAYAFNTDYIYWLPKLKKIQNLLYIGNKPGNEIIGLFSGFKLTGEVENEYAREKGTGIYLLTGAKDFFTPVFYSKVEERKKKLDIF
jgi:hypothetical protein